MLSRPVFVTGYFSIYPKKSIQQEDEDGIKQFKWRLQKFRQLLQSGIQIVLFTDNVSPFEELLQEYGDTFRIGQVLSLNETNLYRDFNDQILRLPDFLNAEKDTVEFLWVMMLKTEFLERAIYLDVFHTQSSVYAWLDFSISYIFKSPEGTLSFLKTLGHSQLELDTVYIPGCWGAKQTGGFAQHILWRFCGGVLLGNTDNLLEMNRLVNHHMPEFLLENGGTLTWEVNYWAWMEYKGYFHPTWYYADHDDWMLLGIPSQACIISLNPIFQQSISCPELLDVSTSPEKWSPSSACFYKQHNEGTKDKETRENENNKNKEENKEITENKQSGWLLVRYVNYRLDNYGSYVFPDVQDDGIIKNENVLFEIEMDECGFYRQVSGSYQLVQYSNNILFAEEVPHPISIGLEDVRLWEDQQGNTNYIATNVNKTTNGLPQVATGLFMMADNPLFLTMMIHQTDHIQKNWIPWTDDEVIYKWCLEGIIFRHLITQETRLVPFRIHNSILSRVRGSSIFIPCWNVGERVALVHYSEEGNPRKYYHLLVVLQETTGVLLRHTLPFYLGEQGEGHRINFCIGFDWTLNKLGERLYHFWFSVMDRDPQYWVIKEDGGVQWCSFEGVNSSFSLHKKWIE